MRPRLIANVAPSGGFWLRVCGFWFISQWPIRNQKLQTSYQNRFEWKKSKAAGV